MSGAALQPALLPGSPAAAGEDLIDALGLLIKADAVYDMQHQRTRGLAERCALAIRELAVAGAATLRIRKEGFAIGDSPIAARGVRLALFAQLSRLNIKALGFGAETTPEDLRRFAARTNDNLRALQGSPHGGEPCWNGLPASITITENRFAAGGLPTGDDDDDEESGARPEGLASAIAAIVEQLGRIHRALLALDGRATREVDIVSSLLQRFRTVEAKSSRPVEELVAEALDRFTKELVTAVGDRNAMHTRGLLREVSRKFFQRWDLTADDPGREASTRRPSERTQVSPLAPDILLVLQKSTEVTPPAIDAADDDSWLGLLLHFLSREENAKVVERLAEQLDRRLEASPGGALHGAVEKTVLERMRDGLDCTSLSPLVARVLDPSRTRAVLAALDLGAEDGIRRSAQLVRLLWPQSVLPLLNRLHRETARVKARCLAAAMREVGRESVLASRDELLRSGLYHDKALTRALFALRIPEVLPLLEVEFYASDPDLRREAGLAAQRFPFRQRASFRLKAAADPAAVPVDYFRSLLRDEWEGRERQEFFEAVLAEECAKAHHRDAEVALPAIRALACAGTDAAAAALIALLKDRYLGILPRQPRAIRAAARRALESMHCQTAESFRLRVRE
ncbi:MAG: hypothetical protein JXQ29_09600 [Planctomycetes bacterium]|nr:hypothetical protein [Planctomycetota bacterium]